MSIIRISYPITSPKDIWDVFDDGKCIVLKGDQTESYAPDERTKLILFEVEPGSYSVDGDYANLTKRLRQMSVSKPYDFETNWAIESGLMQLDLTSNTVLTVLKMLMG
jgi:hypothetical protein